MKTNVNEEMLELVCGGDYGDAANDCVRDHPKYFGQDVEVYNTPIHYTTTRRHIQEAEYRDGQWYYAYVTNYNTPLISKKWITADDIQTR